MDQRAKPHSVPCTLSVNHLYLGLCWAEDISIAGALLDRVDFFEVGSRLEMAVHVPSSETVLLRATVTRCANGGCAVAFDGCDRNALTQALVCLRQPRAHTKPAMVVTRNMALARALGHEIAVHDVEPVQATSPVETFWHLSEAIGTVILDLELVGESWKPWTDLLARDFPAITRAIVTRRPVPPQIAEALGRDGLDAVLTVPCRSPYLRKVITCCCRPPLTHRADERRRAG